MERLRSTAAAATIAWMLVFGVLTPVAAQVNGVNEGTLPAGCSQVVGGLEATILKVVEGDMGIQQAQRLLEGDPSEEDLSEAGDRIDDAVTHLTDAAKCLDTVKQRCGPTGGTLASEIASETPPHIPEKGTAEETWEEYDPDTGEDPVGTVDGVYGEAQATLDGLAGDAAGTACEKLDGVSFQTIVQNHLGTARDVVDTAPGDAEEALGLAEAALDEIQPILEDAAATIGSAKAAAQSAIEIAGSPAECGDYAAASNDQLQNVRESKDICKVWMRDDPATGDTRVLVEMMRRQFGTADETIPADLRMAHQFQVADGTWRVYARYDVTAESWTAQLQRWDDGDSEWTDETEVTSQLAAEGTVVSLPVPRSEVGYRHGALIEKAQTFTFEVDEVSGTLDTMSLIDQVSTAEIADVVEGPIGATYDPMNPEFQDPYRAGSTLDDDGDGVANYRDNCPNTPNEKQIDSDGDGAGDACDSDPTEQQEDPSDDQTNWYDDGTDDTDDSQQDSSSDGDDEASSSGFLGLGASPMSWVLLLGLVALIAVLVGVVVGRR